VLRSDGGDSKWLEQPHPTVCASDDRHALVVTNDHQNRARSSSDPLPTVTTGNRHALVVPLRSNGKAIPVDGVIPTVTAAFALHDDEARPLSTAQSVSTAPGALHG
jgi:hypothetical protein